VTGAVSYSRGASSMFEGRERCLAFPGQERQVRKGRDGQGGGCGACGLSRRQLESARAHAARKARLATRSGINKLRCTASRKAMGNSTARVRA